MFSEGKGKEREKKGKGKYFYEIHKFCKSNMLLKPHAIFASWSLLGASEALCREWVVFQKKKQTEELKEM